MNDSPMLFFGRSMLFSLVACSTLALAQSLSYQSDRRNVSLDDLAIEVKGQSREVAYTNKQGGVLYTETNSEHRSAWQGWKVLSHEVLEDYAVSVDDVPL